MMTSAAHLYEDLMAGPLPCGDSFDVHVAASVLAISFAEAQSTGRSFVDAVGLGGDDLAKLADAFFPEAKTRLLEMAGGSKVDWAADEDCLRDMLGRMSTGGTGYQHVLAAMITRRAQRPNHLWQDLGLQERGDLTQLMQRPFAPLKARNVHDMKWKKFLYRTICRDEGQGFCAAPTCAECDDYAVCFGDEAGQTLLGLARRQVLQQMAAL